MLSRIAALLLISCAVSTPALARNENRTPTCASPSRLDRVQNERDLRDYLSDTRPRFWNELSRSGEREALGAFFELLSTQEEREDLCHFVARALYYARVNDAIYYEEDLLAIMEPSLSAELGWSDHDGEGQARAAADELAQQGSGRYGMFTSLTKFENAHRTVVSRHMTGR